MKTNWTTEDLAASWLVLPEDQKLIGKKQGIGPLSSSILAFESQGAEALQAWLVALRSWTWKVVWIA